MPNREPPSESDSGVECLRGLRIYDTHHRRTILYILEQDGWWGSATEERPDHLVPHPAGPREHCVEQ